MEDLTLAEMVFLGKHKDIKFKVLIYGNNKAMFNGDLLDKNMLGIYFLGERTTKCGYIMYHMGNFPLVSDLDPTDYPVLGELYEVGADVIVQLDRENYHSSRKEIELSDNTKCEMYVSTIRLSNKQIPPNVDGYLEWRGVK